MVKLNLTIDSYSVIHQWDENDLVFVKLSSNSSDVHTVWKYNYDKDILEETLFVTLTGDGQTLYNGGTIDEERFYQVGHMSEIDGQTDFETGSIGIFSFFSTIKRQYGNPVGKTGRI